MIGFKARHADNKSATRGAQLVPIGIPITCQNNLVPNRIKMLSTKKSAHHIHFDKTMRDIFQAFPK